MSSFGFGFWAGLVLGFVLAALWNQEQDFSVELPMTPPSP